MGQSYDNIDDWEIIKEYKKERLKNLNKLKNNYRKKNNKFKRDKKKLDKEIAVKDKNEQVLSKELSEISNQRSMQYRAKRSQLHSAQGEIRRFNEKSDFYQHDIDLSQKRQDEIDAEASVLRTEIESVKAKIKELKAKQQPKKKMAGKKAAKTTEECPKKCRVENLKISCDHADSRGFTLSVPPHEPGSDIPYLHVISSHARKSYDVVDVDFSGSCDHGKKSKSKVSEDFKEFSRTENYTEFCPRVSITNPETSTHVIQPSKVKFAAALSDKCISEYVPGTAELRLVTDLIFKRNQVVKEYDLQFESCKGDLPYKATVVAHPAWKWNFELSFAYKAATKLKKEKTVWETIKSLVVTKPTSYDDENINGGWEAAVKAGYTYDIHEWSYEDKLSFQQLSDKLGGTWSFLQNIYNMFENINGFFEMAEVKNKAAKAAQKASKVKVKDKHLADIEVQWPNIKMSGNATKVELSNSPEVGVKGDFTLAFAPLFGIKGEIDVIQVLLATMGGPFGNFLRKASQMSIGEVDADGEIDTTKPYIDTNLELKIGATTNISGAVGFMAEEESFWKAATAEAKLSSGESGATAVSGSVGLILTGTALVKGMVWSVNFTFGGEFKTTDESGGKHAGFEVSLKPIVINDSYSALGTLEFTGLAIVYALYKKFEGAGVVDEETEDDDEEGDYASATASEPKKENPDYSAKSERKAVLFKRKPLLSNNKDMVSLDAYKTTN